MSLWAATPPGRCEARARMGAGMLRLSGGGISGDLLGRAVTGLTRMGSGAKLVPGRYRQLPPVDDPIYGTVVTALPLSQAPIGYSYDLKNVLVSSSHRTGLPDGSFALSERQLPGVSTLIVYNGHAGLVMAVREAAGRGELTVA